MVCDGISPLFNSQPCGRFEPFYFDDALQQELYSRSPRLEASLLQRMSDRLNRARTEVMRSLSGHSQGTLSRRFEFFGVAVSNDDSLGLRPRNMVSLGTLHVCIGNQLRDIVIGSECPVRFQLCLDRIGRIDVTIK